MCEPKIFHAFFSENGAAYAGTCMWETSDGKRLEICAAYPTKEDGEQNYRWDDKQYLGEVVRCVRANNKPIFNPFAA